MTVSDDFRQIKFDISILTIFCNSHVISNKKTSIVCKENQKSEIFLFKSIWVEFSTTISHGQERAF